MYKNIQVHRTNILIISFYLYFFHSPYYVYYSIILMKALPIRRLEVMPAFKLRNTYKNIFRPKSLHDNPCPSSLTCSQMTIIFFLVGASSLKKAKVKK